MKKGILEDLFEVRRNDALLWALDTDQKYQQAVNVISRRMNRLKKMKFRKDQRQAVDQAIFAEQNRSAEVSRVAYQLGFQDALELFAEVSAITGKYSRHNF